MQQNPNIEGLVPLSDAHDFKVAEGNRDVRGWTVRTRDGEKVGKVNDLLVDTNALRARYVDVELDGGLFGSSRRVLIPVGAAQLGDDELVVDVARDGLNDYPAYDGSSLTRDYETSVRDRIGAAGFSPRGDLSSTSTSRTDASRDFYDHEVYDDRRFLGSRDIADRDEARLTLSEEQLDVSTRRVEAGQAYLRKTVETERVREEVPLMHEEVTVERRPISADSRVDATISEDEIRVPLMAEEVVTQKRVVPKEEVVVRKHAVTGTEVVEEDVRRERADVDEASLRGRARNAGGHIANAADDLKDRVDGNPASRPGPDATDSRF